MFDASLSDAKLFVSIIRALSLVDEGTFIVTPEKIYFAEMDPAKVAMVELELPNSVFEKFNCDTKTFFKVSIDDLKKISKRVRSDDIIELILDEKENRFLIKLVSRISRTFSVALHETDATEQKKPQIPFKTNIKLVPEVIKNAVMDAKVVGDYIEIKATSEKLVFESASNVGEVKVEILRDGETVLEYNIEEESRAVYPLSYLEDMIAAAPAADIVSISFSTNMPLKLDFLIPGGGRVTYYLAPRREA